MGKSVAKVQKSPLPAFELVSRNDSSLHACCSSNKRHKFFSINIFPTQGIAGFAVVVVLIAYYESLQHLGGTGKQVAPRKRRQNGRIDVCKLRLSYDTDHIFIFVEIDTGLATDCGIDHCQKGGRDIGKSHSPLVY